MKTLSVWMVLFLATPLLAKDVTIAWAAKVSVTGATAAKLATLLVDEKVSVSELAGVEARELAAVTCEQRFTASPSATCRSKAESVSFELSEGIVSILRSEREIPTVPADRVTQWGVERVGCALPKAKAPYCWIYVTK